MTQKPRVIKLNPDRYQYGDLFFPSILIKGYWFREYGFKPGDIVQITSPQRRTLVMKVFKTVEELQTEKMKQEQEAGRKTRKNRKARDIERFTEDQ